MSLDGVLLSAHGSIEALDDLPAFLARIRRGRPAPDALVEELRRRYQAIGGSPFLGIVERQARALKAATGLPVFIGMRLWRPEIGTALAEAISRGLRRLVVLPLAPYSVPVYLQAAERALAERGEPRESLRLVGVAAFGTDPLYVSAHARAIQPLLANADPETSELVLTAHSLPRAAIAAGDSYTLEVEASARAIGEALGRPYVLAYQSQGADGGDWVGPTLREAFEAARSRGKKRLIVAPFGFLSEHIETRYDLDIEARAFAAELALDFIRVPALDDSPDLIRALAHLVEHRLNESDE